MKKLLKDIRKYYEIEQKKNDLNLSDEAIEIITDWYEMCIETCCTIVPEILALEGTPLWIKGEISDEEYYYNHIKIS